MVAHISRKTGNIHVLPRGKQSKAMLAFPWSNIVCVCQSHTENNKSHMKFYYCALSYNVHIMYTFYFDTSWWAKSAAFTPPGSICLSMWKIKCLYQNIQRIQTVLSGGLFITSPCFPSYSTYSRNNADYLVKCTFSTFSSLNHWICQSPGRIIMLLSKPRIKKDCLRYTMFYQKYFYSVPEFLEHILYLLWSLQGDPTVHAGCFLNGTQTMQQKK